MLTEVPSPLQVTVNCWPVERVLMEGLVNEMAEAKKGIKDVATRATKLRENCIVGVMGG